MSGEAIRGQKKKAQEVSRLSQLIEAHESLLIVDLRKIPTEQVRLLRERVRGKAVVRVAKNRLFLKAVEASSRRLENLSEHMRGPNIFIFTNDDPFEVANAVQSTRVKLPVRAGDTAPCDIIVPAGSTGLPAGPIMGEFSEAGLPVKVELGSIVILRDAVVARRGEAVKAAVASALLRLGIKPIESVMQIKAAYYRGLLIPAKLLRMSEVIRGAISEACDSAFRLAVGSRFFIDLTIPLLAAEAAQNCRWLANRIALPIPEVVPDILARAMAEAQAIAQIVEKSEKRA